MKVDLTVLAIPAFVGAMAAEYAWQKRNPAIGERAGDYEFADTMASLSMGVGSLLAPYISATVLSPPQLGMWPCTAHVRVEGAHPLDIGLACDLDSARALACARLGLAPADCDDALALDALGEMVNVLMGYAVREVLPDELGANQNASFAAWPNYVAVAVNRPLRARVLFACDLELRDDLTEADCEAIYSDLMELQAMFEASACGKVH